MYNKQEKMFNSLMNKLFEKGLDAYVTSTFAIYFECNGEPSFLYIPSSKNFYYDVKLINPNITELLSSDFVIDVNKLVVKWFNTKYNVNLRSYGALNVDFPSTHYTSKYNKPIDDKEWKKILRGS